MPCFSSHICLPGSVVLLQPSISLWRCCLKTQFLCMDLSSDLDCVIRRCRGGTMALCCLFPMPYLTHSLYFLSLSLFLLALPHRAPLSLLNHLFSSQGLGSFYCLKGTLLTTHICPFIILRGLFYSCPSTVADTDQCLAMLNRSDRATLGQHMDRDERGNLFAFCNETICEEERKKYWRDGKMGFEKCWVRRIKGRTDGHSKKNSKERGKKR